MKRYLMILCLVLALLMASVGALGEPAPSNTPIMINDVRTAFFAPDGTYLPVMEDAGCVYVPVCAMGESLKLDVTADAATLAVTVNGVRAAFFDESGAYLPPVLMNGVVYAPIQAFLDTCGVNYALQDGAYLITLGAVEATAVPTSAPTAAPVYGYVPLGEFNFKDFFTLETSCSYPDINTDLRAYTVTHRLTCQATTSYGLENVSFKVGTFGTIRMPASGYVTDTHENTIYSYNYDNDMAYAFDQAITAELALLTTYPLESASGSLRMSWQEAQALNQSYYDEANGAMEHGSYDEAITMFDSLASVDFADSADRAKAARDAKAAAEKAAADKREQEKEDKYNQALAAMEQKDYATAIPMLEALSDESYKDSGNKLAEALDGLNQQEYETADVAFAQGDYDTALVIFTSLGDGNYADAADRVPAVRYALAEQHLAAGYYQPAIEAFLAAGDYSDAADRAQDARYQQAEAFMAESRYWEASDAYAAIPAYKDASARKQEADYQQAQLEEAGENYTKARDLYSALGDYKDSADRAGQMAMAIEFAKADALAAKGDYQGAAEVLQPHMDASPEAEKRYWQAQFRVSGTVAAMSVEGTGWVVQNGHHTGNHYFKEPAAYALMDYKGNVLVTGEYSYVSEWNDGLSYGTLNTGNNIYL